jgi:hypothetical protein
VQLIWPSTIHAYAFDVTNTNELNADIVAPVALVCSCHEFLHGDIQIVIVADKKFDLGLRYRSMQAIGTEHQNVARQDLDLSEIRRNEEVASQGTGQHMPHGGIRSFSLGQQPEPYLFVCNSVVARQQLCVSATHEITARVSYVTHHGAIRAQSASHKSCGHCGARLFSCYPGVQHYGVRLLDQTRQKRAMRFPIRGSAEAIADMFYSEARSDLAAVVTSHTIGQREQPATGTRRRSRVRDHKTKIVFILLAGSTGIGELRKFEIEHGRRRRRMREAAATHWLVSSMPFPINHKRAHSIGRACARPIVTPRLKR